MSNGCGCESGLFSHFRPPYARLFDIPCRLHDDDYDMATVSRRTADRLLFTRMCKVVQGLDGSPIKAVWLYHVALLYYVSVRVFGGLYYNQTKRL